MNTRARDTGKIPYSQGRRPGWFARSPAMVILSNLLRGFLTLRPMVNSFSAWSHTIASRWMPRRFIKHAWRPILKLSRQRGKASQTKKEIRSTLNPPGRKQDNRWALHTLSLPKGVRLEESIQETWGWGEKASPIEPDQETEQSRGIELENRPPAYAETLSGSESGFLEVEPSTTQVSPRREQTRISRSAWPFRLVGPLPERREPPALHLKREMELGRKYGSRLPVGEILARGSTNLGYREQAHSQLKPRQMVTPQVPITVSLSRLIPRQPGQSSEPLTFLQRRWQLAAKRSPDELPAASLEDQQSWPLDELPAASLENQQSWPPDELPAASLENQQSWPPEPRDINGRMPHRSAIHLESGESLGGRGTPAEVHSLELARVARQEVFHARASSSQVRPPSAMLTLLAAHQPVIEPGRAPSERSAWGQAEQDWPLLSILRRIETQPEEPGESSGLQVLRRMWPEQAPALRQAVTSISSLGPGEALAPEVRRWASPQTQLGRDLRDVRLHVSPLAQTLRAEAFTSGKHVVFAPGRLDLTTSKGIALLGHELTHIGQPLAFKQESGAGQAYEDSGEQAARHQEEQIQRIVEQGWTKTNRMELQHSFRTAAVPPASANSLSIQRIAEENAGSAQQEEPGGSPASINPADGTSGQSGGVTRAASQASAAPASGPAGAPPPAANVEALARQVYGILKNRLRAERDRHQLYNL